MFPLSFPLRQLKNARRGDWVIDPFCGRGSTNYAARLYGLPSMGVDVNPVAAAIAQAKGVSATPQEVVTACERILVSGDGPRSVPEGQFWSVAFHEHTLKQLCRIRESLLDNCRSPARKALRALLLGRLHGPKAKGRKKSYCSNQMPRTYASKPGYAVGYWREHGSRPPKVDVLELVRRKAPAYFSALPPTVPLRLVRGDSRTLDFAGLLPKGERARWVITSPPYYGMRTYVPDQWLRYWFVGGPETVAYEFSNQLLHTSPEEFAEQLALVWRNVASACHSGARLVVRFGSIPERTNGGLEVLRDSLNRADSHWRVTTIRPAGAADRGRRQATQFGLKDSTSRTEFDLFARLST